MSDVRVASDSARTLQKGSALVVTYRIPLNPSRFRLRGVRARLMRLSATRAVMLMAVLFLLLLASGDGVLLWLQHQSRLDEATQDAANLTIVLEQHVRQMFNNLDGLLQDYIELTTDHGRSPA